MSYCVSVCCGFFRLLPKDVKITLPASPWRPSAWATWNPEVWRRRTQRASLSRSCRASGWLLLDTLSSWWFWSQHLCRSPRPELHLTFENQNMHRVSWNTGARFKINSDSVRHLTTTSYSSIREPSDLLERIPPFPTMMHLLQLRLPHRNEQLSQTGSQSTNRIPASSSLYLSSLSPSP